MTEQNISKLEARNKQKRQKLEQLMLVLVIKYMLHMSNRMSNHVAEKPHMPVQNCGYVDHQSSTCSQAEVCPHMQSMNHSVMYICPLLKAIRYQEKEYREYKSDVPSLGYSKGFIE